MALASSRTTSTKLLLPEGERTPPLRSLTLPGMLQCLVMSWSELRTQLLRSAAENEDWQAVVCRDVNEFVRRVFQLNTPLTIVDLPKSDSTAYAGLCKAATRARDINDSLLVVCGTNGNTKEEVWARQLGAWTYLPAATDLAGLEMVFGEARKALARKSSAYVESDAYR